MTCVSLITLCVLYVKISATWYSELEISCFLKVCCRWLAVLELGGFKVWPPCSVLPWEQKEEETHVLSFLQGISQESVKFTDVAVVFSLDLWAPLSPEERALYQDVGLGTCAHLALLGCWTYKSEVMSSLRQGREPGCWRERGPVLHAQSPSGKADVTLICTRSIFFPLWLVLQFSLYHRF